LPRGLDRHRALPATEVLVGRIAWLIRLRWLAVAGTLLGAEVAPRVLPVQLHSGRIHIVLLALVGYNLIAWMVVRRRARLAAAAIARQPPEQAATPASPALEERRPDDRPGILGRTLLPRTSVGTLPYNREAGAAAAFALVQIVTDQLLLALLLHFTGGIENPIWVFFTFHVIFASVLLSAPATYAIAGLGSLLLAGIAVGELSGVLVHHPLGVFWSDGAYRLPALVAGYLALQVATLFAAAYLASSITARLRRREVDVLVLTRQLADKAERLEAAYQELSIAERAKSQYMRKVAHELRQPLGTVKTALAVALQSPGDMQPQTRQLIERAERRAGALADMTQELLALARARGGGVAANLAPVDLAPVAARVIEEMQAKAADAGVSLTVELQLGIPPVQGDAEGLGDLLVNLIGNAIRYTPAGGHVWFRAQHRADRILLEVEDTGIGIATAERERIFDEFYRAPAAREHFAQGSGLGLAIARAVVEQHRGRISVHDRDGGGSIFRVELPLADEPALVAAG